MGSCAAWCCCSTVSSLLSSCCGNEKSSHQPPGPTSGRKRSVTLVFISICLQLLFQFVLAPYILDNLTTNNLIRKAWLDGCNTSTVDDVDDTQLRSCVSIAGNFRVAAVTTLFFMMASIITYCHPTANREAWPIKIILYLCMVAATIVIPNEPYFTPIYFVIAIGTFYRMDIWIHNKCINIDSLMPINIFPFHSVVGGVVFICLQQIVILDCSYNWNDSWYVKN